MPLIETDTMTTSRFDKDSRRPNTSGSLLTKDTPWHVGAQLLTGDGISSRAGGPLYRRAMLGRNLASLFPHAWRAWSDADSRSQGGHPAHSGDCSFKGCHGALLFYHVRDSASNTNVMQLADPITSVKTDQHDLSDIAGRLAWARGERELSQTKLSELAGVSQGTIGNVESGSRKNPRELLAIAKAVGVHAEWLKTGKGPVWLSEGQERSGSVKEPLAAYRIRTPRPVWVIGKTQGGWPERIWDDAGFPVGGANEYAEVLSTDEHAFVVQVVGDSMMPRYQPREYALVEPGTTPDIEDDVLVRLVTGETMLKRLLSRRGGIRLGSYNSPEVLFFELNEVSWMYYVSHPVPAKKIKDWVDSGEYQGPDRRVRQEHVGHERRRAAMLDLEGGRTGNAVRTKKEGHK